MKTIMIVLAVSSFVIIGILFALIALYASPDEQVHFTEAGFFWMGDAVVLFGLLIYFKKSHPCNESNKD